MPDNPDAMQNMLNRLHCMLRESTSLSILRSLRWFNSIHLVQMCLCSTNVGRVPLAHENYFNYLGMMFHRFYNEHDQVL